MRLRLPSLLVFGLAMTAGCGVEHLLQGGGADAGAHAADAGADSAPDAAISGAGCGIESGTSTQLCRATSACPSVVVDTQALPHCGFRIKGGSSELVCACGDSICSMGTFATCAQAQKLLTSQTELQVCTQVAEGRCSEVRAAAGSSSPNGSSASPTCDRVCLSECGGGAACASICGC